MTLSDFATTHLLDQFHKLGSEGYGTDNLTTEETHYSVPAGQVTDFKD